MQYIFPKGMGEGGRRGARGLNIDSLPYSIRLYSNNQVLIPARLVRKLGLQDLKFAVVKIRVEGNEHVLRVRLLRTRYTDSRQFTIPKELREKYKLKAGAIIDVIDVAPLETQ